MPSALRMFMAALLTETNTFAPLPTGHDSFHDAGFHRTGGSLARPAWANIPLIEWRRLAEAAQLEVVESLCADARSAGTTVRATYEGLRDAILNDLRHAGPVDIVLLNLHGAMVTEGYDDARRISWRGHATSCGAIASSASSSTCTATSTSGSSAWPILS